jgi:ribosomal protein L21E
LSGSHHIRVEVDLNTFNAVYYVDGDRVETGAPAADQLANFVTAWNGKTQVVLDMSGNAYGACVLDNFMVYTIETN